MVVSRPDTRWFAIRTKKLANHNRTTQVINDHRVFVVEVLLRNEGFEVFLPTRKVWRRRSKYTRNKQLVSLPMFVGWVFVGWPTSENRWQDLFRLGIVGEIAGFGGRPLAIDQSEMRALFDRWGGQSTHAPERERFMRTHFEFDIGDPVSVVEGPLDGVSAKVVNLHGSKASILVELFGGTQEIDIDTMSLIAA